MILRPYQQDLVDRVRASFRAGKKAPVIVLGTGGGKTVIFSYIAKNSVAKGGRTWILAHRKELIRQASKTLRGFDVPNGIIKAGIRPMPHLPVQVASVQTLAGRIGKITPATGVVVDEGHHATSPTYRKIFAGYPDAWVIGVTATPCRLDGKGLGDVFDDIILGPTNTELTEWGYLAPVRYFAPPQQASLEGVRVRRGDYVTSDLEKVLDRKVITGDAVEHYRRICDGVPMIAFCVSVTHAKNVAEAYREAGYRAAHVDGNLSDDDRDDRINGLATGKYQVVTSCDLIGEGLDIPVCVAVQLLRPTTSLSVHLQQIGRPIRPIYGDGYPLETDDERRFAIASGMKPFAFVLDHVGNLARHGFVTTEREWTLDGVKSTKRKQGEPSVEVRTCLQCFAAHEPAPECPYCGYVYPVKPRRLHTVKGTLEEIQAEKQMKKKEVEEAKTFSELVAIGISRGYKRPSFWAKCVWGGRQKARRKG